jgi:chromosome segregation ATPase
VQGEVDGLKGRKREMMAEFEELEKNVEKLRGQKEVYDEGERQTQGMYGELLRQQSKLEVDEANFMTRNKAMEDTVANLKQSIDGLYGTVEGEKDTTSKLEDQLQKAKNDLEYWERSLFQVKNKNKELLNQKETLDGRVEDLKETIKTHESNISEVATLVGQKETSLATLEYQLKSHSDNLISLNTTHTHLEAKSESFKSEIVTVTDQHSELTSIIDTLKSEVSKLHTVKNSNNETWTNYIQEIIKSCKKLTGECHS